ncbi:MAG: copper homeostasis periplasmic binding protein CopC [Burkholderiales bacterium]|jgi:methionine-rich copper-binding protein CopC|nr:copper homeostasis periplasmic binding protein CopC [Burkholderiales bacterium]
MKKTFTLAVLSLASAVAFAHARLQSSTPANGASVGPAPTELRLQYNEPVEAAMSSVRITGPGDAAVATDRVVADPGDDKVLVQPLPRLAAGDYRVQWTTMGHDGHHTKGEIRFAVK